MKVWLMTNQENRRHHLPLKVYGHATLGAYHAVSWILAKMNAGMCKMMKRNPQHGN